MIFGRSEDVPISTAAGVVGAGFLSLGSPDCAIEAESGCGGRIIKAIMTAVQTCRLIRCDLCFVDVVLRMGLPQSGDDRFTRWVGKRGMRRRAPVVQPTPRHR